MLTQWIRHIFCFLFLVMGATVFSQSSGLRLQKSAKGFYLEHKVLPKQSLFSIGRIYSVHPQNLAAYNGLDMNKGIQIDQVIRVPLSDTNFQRKQGEGVPIFLYASTDDILSDMSQFVGVDVRELQCWNKYSGTDVKKGTNWVVGFLMTSEPSMQKVNLSCGFVQPDSTISKGTEKPPTSKPSSFFATEFAKQISKSPLTQELSVLCAVFKSESGHTDGKHYVLIDNLIPGTVVRLYNPGNKKEAFAKVLGEMPRIKQNEGLDIRISDATASYLGLLANDRYTLQVSY
ncbi:MAG: LysM peptidoglycan-binding domain-containing protein [Bacteroidota bacterium]